MLLIDKNATITGTVENVKLTHGAAAEVRGTVNGTAEVRVGSKLTVLGYFNGGALVLPGGLLHVSGYTTFAPHTFLEGEVQLAGYVNVPFGATRLLPGGHQIYVRPGTVFNAGGGQHLLDTDGSVRQLFGSNNITIDGNVWMHYDVLTNSFTPVK